MDLKSRMSQANTAAEEFSKLYYETFDKRRQAISKLYQDKASVVWNGNAVSGTDAIMKFFDGLPSSEHTVEGLDTQPIVTGSAEIENANSIIVTVMGKTKFKGNEAQAFTQTFVLSAAENKWKIISDVFRYMQ